MTMGPYCRYCDQRCFVDRELPADAKAWAGQHLIMATCAKGMAHDLEETGYTHLTALNPRDTRWVAVLPEDGREVRVGPYKDLWDLGREFDMDELDAERLGESEGWNPASVAAWLARLLGLPEDQVRIEQVMMPGGQP